MKLHPSLLLACLVLTSQPLDAADAAVEKAEVVVYGGTPGGVMAAVEAARQGHRVALINVSNHVGGVISGGLTNTDIGSRATMGGLAQEFIDTTVNYYRDKYGKESPQYLACNNGRKFEPHVAELTFEKMLKVQPGITVWKGHRYRSVTLEGGRITALLVDNLAAKSTRTFTGEVFIDASYEGDLMAGAKVPYRVGREGAEEFGETLAGISIGPDKGKADKLLMAYNYRVSITKRTENRVLFPKPGHYDPEPFRERYEARILSGKIKTFGDLFISKPGANDKHDANWCDLVDGSHDYPEADWETRAKIEAKHRDYFLSLLWYLQNDPELPETFRTDAQQWGLPKDEFADNGHFPYQLYVREARRMVGSYVMRESDLTQNRQKPDGVCAGSYGVDCHIIQRLMVDGKLRVDRTPHISVDPYDIPYASLTPREPGNLLVPVCCSTTHVVYCSLRMEPTYMMLGHASGAAAHLAIAGRTTVQKVDTGKLREILSKEGMVLDAGSTPPTVTAEGKKVVTKAKSWPPKPEDKNVTADVIVYGGTPAGVMAAIAAARHGHTVALVDINAHIGGVVSGGLVASDMGDTATIGGLSMEFFTRIVKYYTDKYGADSKEFKACRNGATFEPHVAEFIFEQMIKEQPGIQVWRSCRYRGVLPEFGRTEGSDRVTALVVDDIATKTTRTFHGDLFIDASYEGDLMAGAMVPYRVGREARAEYGEQLAGVSMGPMQQRGMGDHRSMAYNYRVTVTSDTTNRVLFPKPEHYDPAPFIATHGKRILEGRAQGFGDFFTTIDKAHPGLKYDANWFDWPGNSEGYAEGSWELRDRIAARIRDRALSLLYYVQNDPALPEAFLIESRKWGLPKDEFTDNGHFPFQLYVREARRMVGTYVLREQDLTQDRWKADGIATGSYGIDCHTVQFLREGDRLVPEHTRHVACNNYDIPYRSLIPPDVVNLLVPVCCSATHIAYCSLRMEPVYMMLGHAAGDAAHLALTTKKSVQKVDAKALRELLLSEGSVLDCGYQPQVKLTWTPKHPKPGEKVIFKAVSSTLKDPLKQIVWDFDGTGKVGGEGERVVRSFDLEKVHTISLLVTDEAGRKRLLSAEVPVGSTEARDITVDEFDAEMSGRWNGTLPDYVVAKPLRYSDVFTGPGTHRDVVTKGKVGPVRIHFQPTLPRTGRYQVCIGFRPSKAQATNTPITIKHAAGTAKLAIDQRTETTPFAFVPVGEFTFKAGNSGSVDLTNRGADGRIAIDAVRWVWVGE